MGMVSINRPENVLHVVPGAPSKWGFILKGTLTRLLLHSEIVLVVVEVAKLL